MNLLILTQKVSKNDDVLGFMCGWIFEFAKHFSHVTVICLEARDYDLPDNVSVFSLGKEKLPMGAKSGVRDRLKYLKNFYKLIWREKNNYDAVFVHMDHMYVVLGGLLWRAWGKKIAMWYAHGHVSKTLRLAEKLTHLVFTSTATGFRLPSRKLNIVGQGIDVLKFSCEGSGKRGGDVLKIISVGRISRVKDYGTLIEAARILADHGVNFEISVIGKAPAEEGVYLEELKEKISGYGLDDRFKFWGGVPNIKIREYLCSADLFVNMSHTGSLDKAILEAMASGLPILTCNEALLDVLGEYKNVLMYKKGDSDELAQKIRYISNMAREERIKLGDSLRNIVERDHNLSGLIKKIAYVFQNN